MHLVANYYFKTWQQQCKFVQNVFSEQIEMKLLDGKIYNEGGRAMRLVGSTKFGVDSFLTPHQVLALQCVQETVQKICF